MDDNIDNWTDSLLLMIDTNVQKEISKHIMRKTSAHFSMAHEPKEASVFKHRKMMLKAIVIAGDA